MDAGAVLALGAGAIAAVIIIVMMRRRDPASPRAVGRPERRTAAFDPDVPPIPLERLFAPGFTAGSGASRQTFEVRHVGDLVLTTGRIVASDPLVSPDAPPFDRAVQPGAYRVEVSIGRAPHGDERIAAARVVFRDGTPARWELACTAGQRRETLGDGEWFGYGVDAGLGCFMDAAAGRLLVASIDALPADASYYDTVIAAELDASYQHTRSFATHRPDASRRENVVMFSSGFGDGVYSSWWGLDDAGEPMTLVTDFATVSADDLAPQAG